MPEKVQVKNLTTGQSVWMWEVDAEEAQRRAPTVYAPQTSKPIPPKNPGGRGF